MNIFAKSAYKFIDRLLRPYEGLSREIFLVASQLVPLVNIEIIATNKSRNALILIYRHDSFYGPGWHLPGGIIRSREDAHERLRKTLSKEMGIDLSQTSTVRCVGISQAIDQQRPVRSHFISLVFALDINDEDMPCMANPQKMYMSGDIASHRDVPTDLIEEHRKYQELINTIMKGEDVNCYSIMKTLHTGRW